MSAPAYGFIGLGRMGGPMAGNLAKARPGLAVFDAAGTAERAPPGTVVAASVADVARAADCIFLSLPDGDAVSAVAGAAIAASGRRAAELIDLSTIGVAAAHGVAARCRAAGMVYHDAPVSGGRAGALAATIAVMWAGPAERLAAHRPALAAMAKNVFHVGTEPGQGQALKLLNNYLSATATAATAEALLFGQAHGLDARTILDAVNVSTGRSDASERKFVRHVLTGSYDSGFGAAQMAKDMALFRAALAEAGTAGTIGAAVAELWRRAGAALPEADHTRLYPWLKGGGAQ